MSERYRQAMIAGFPVEIDTELNEIVWAQDGVNVLDAYRVSYIGPNEGLVYQKCCEPCIAAYGPFAGDPRGHCPCDHCNPRLRPHYPNWPKRD